MALNKMIGKAAKGERKAQYALYRYCFPYLMPVCLRYRINEQDALAALNQAFYKILVSLRKFEKEEVFIYWTKRITINTLIDEHRKHVKRPDHIKLDHSANGMKDHFDYNRADQVLQAEDILQMLSKLPEPCRTVFNLYAMDGYSHAEIGGKLDISEGTSRWHLHKARKLLQKMLPDYLEIETVDSHGKQTG